MNEAWEKVLLTVMVERWWACQGDTTGLAHMEDIYPGVEDPQEDDGDECEMAGGHRDIVQR